MKTMKTMKALWNAGASRPTHNDDTGSGTVCHSGQLRGEAESDPKRAPESPRQEYWRKVTRASISLATGSRVRPGMTTRSSRTTRTDIPRFTGLRVKPGMTTCSSRTTRVRIPLVAGLRVTDASRPARNDNGSSGSTRSRRSRPRRFLTLLLAAVMAFTPATPVFAADDPQGTGNPAVPPSFTHNPDDSTYSENAPARLYVRADSSDGGYLTYEWRQSKAYPAPQNKNNPAIKTDEATTVLGGDKSVLDFTTPTVDDTTYYYYWVTVTNHVDSNGDGDTTDTGETNWLDSGIAEVKVVDRKLFTSIQYGNFEAYAKRADNYLSPNYNPVNGYWNTTHDGTTPDPSAGYTATSNPRKVIEVYGTSTYNTTGNNTTQVAELSSYATSTIYQEIATVPGKIYEWSLDHAARNNGGSNPQVVAVVIGPAINDSTDYDILGIGDKNRWIDDTNAPPDYVYPYGKNYTTYFFDVVSKLAQDEEKSLSDFRTMLPDQSAPYTTVYGGNTYYVYLSSDAKDAYFTHRSGAYTVPSGQGTTVFGFVPVTTDMGVGNLLDNITFASGTPVSPEQAASYSGDSSISAQTKAGYAYALAEVRGSSVNELTGLSAQYDPDAVGSGAAAASISPTPGLGSGGWYTQDSGNAAFTGSGTITFHNLTPGKTYRIIGIPANAINSGLKVNESPGAVLDNGYYSDVKLMPASGGDTGAFLPAYSMELVDGKVQLTLQHTNSEAQYALLTDSGGSPVTANPAVAWTRGTGADLVFAGLSAETTYYLVARPRDYTEITYAGAAYSDTSELIAQQIVTPALATVDVAAEYVTRESGGTTITISAEGLESGYTYAAVDPATGAIAKSAVASDANISFTGLNAANTYQIVASPNAGSYLPGVRVYPYANTVTQLNIDYAAELIGAGTGGAGNVPAGVEYRVSVGSAPDAVYLAGAENSWAAFPGTERLDLADGSVVAAGTIPGNDFPMSILDALDTLHTKGTIAYRVPVDAGYTGSAVQPELTLDIPARPAAPAESTYAIDYAAESISFTGENMRWARSGAGTDITGDGTVSFADVGWGTGAAAVSLTVWYKAAAQAFASATAPVEIRGRPAAPEGLGAELADNLNDGITITGLINGRTYQYKESKLTSWTTFTASGTTETLPFGEGHDDYDIRYAATATDPASFFITVSTPLNVESISFGAPTYGAPITGLPIKIHNIVTESVTVNEADVTLEGDNAGSFTLEKSGSVTIAGGTTNSSWNIIPNTNLPVGNYHTTVQVNYTSGASTYTASANVYLTINKADWNMTQLTAEIENVSSSGFSVTVDNAPLGASLSYSAQSGSWQSGNVFSELINAATIYNVRVRANGDDNHNQSSAVTVATVHTPFATPVVANVLHINYSDETLAFANGVSPANYTVMENETEIKNGDSLSALAAAGPINLSLVRKTDGTFPDSAPAIATIPAKADAPDATSQKNATSDTLTDGTINCAGSFQYRVSRNDGSLTQGWQTATDVANVSAGRYEVRKAPTDSTFASKIKSVTVASSNPTVTAHTKTAAGASAGETIVPSYIVMPSGSGWNLAVDQTERPGQYDHAYNVSPLALPSAVTSSSHVFKGWYEGNNDAGDGYNTGTGVFTGNPVTNTPSGPDEDNFPHHDYYAKWAVRPTVTGVTTHSYPSDNPKPATLGNPTNTNGGLSMNDPVRLDVRLAENEYMFGLSCIELSGQSNAELYLYPDFTDPVAGPTGISVGWGAEPRTFYLKTVSADDDKTVVYYALDVYTTKNVSFTVAQTGGTAGVKTTTDIEIKFSSAAAVKGIADLPESNITITGETGTAVKGSLTGQNDIYTLSVTDVSQGTIHVEIKDVLGYTVENTSPDTDAGENATTRVVDVYGDKTAPTGTISIKENEFKEFLNKATFGLFFKDTVDVTVSAVDTDGDGIQSLKYLTAVSPYTSESIKQAAGWVNGTVAEGAGSASFSVSAEKKFFAYAWMTDAAGNETIIDADGVVVYTDSAADTTEISYTKLSNADQTADVTLNGNTIKSISDGTDTLTAGSDYVLSNNPSGPETITFNASYLETLAANDYTLTISYKPLGEEYEENMGGGDVDKNEKPGTTEIALEVVKADSTVTLTANPLTPATYGANNVTLTAVVAKSGTSAQVPTGKVTFYNGAAALGAGAELSGVALDENGKASITITLDADTYTSIRADYDPDGDPNYLSGTGDLGSYTVDKAEQTGLIIKNASGLGAADEDITGKTVPLARETPTVAASVSAAGGQGGDYSWSSDKEAVAEIDAASGAITAKSPGTAVITLTSVESDNYNEASVSFTLNVATEKTAPVPGGAIEQVDTVISASDPAETSGDSPTWNTTLSWNKAKDNISLDENLKYYVYQHESTIDDMESVASAEHGDLLNPGGTNNIASRGVSGLKPDTSYWFNIVVVDEAGNKAAYKAVHVMTPVTVSVESAVQQGGVDGKVATTGILVTFDRAVFGPSGSGGSFSLPTGVSFALPTDAPDEFKNPDGSSATWLLHVSGSGIANGMSLDLNLGDWIFTEGSQTHSYRAGITSKSFIFYNQVKQETPVGAYIDYVARTIAGLIPNEWYFLGNDTPGIGRVDRQASATGDYPINDTWLGENIDVIRKGGDNTVDSAANVLDIPTRPPRPEVSVHNPTSADDPSVVTVTNPVANTAYQYRVGIAGQGGEPIYGEWQDVPDGDPTDTTVTLNSLPGGRYTIRVKAVAEVAEMTPGSFSSVPTAFYVHDFGEVRFDAQLQGYELPAPENTADPLAPQTVHVAAGETVTEVAWTGTNADSAEDWFILDGTGNTWTIQPEAGLTPGLHAAQITITYSGDTPSENQPVTFTVHPKAEFADGGVAVTDEDEDGLSDTMTLTFKYPIVGGLQWDEVVVNSAVIKKPGVSGFKNADNTQGNTVYVIDIVPASPAVKTGDNASVVVRLDLHDKLDTYQKQNADQGRNYISGTAPIEVSRAIDAAEIFPALLGYSTSALQFTLEKSASSYPIIATGGHPDSIYYYDLLADAYEGPVKVTDSSGEPIPGLKITMILPIDEGADTVKGVKYAYTWRVFFELNDPFDESVTGVKVSIPGFNVAEAAAPGTLSKAKGLTDARYILDNGGINYLSDMHMFQKLPPVSAAGLYVAPEVALKTSADLGAGGVEDPDVSIEEVFIDIPGDDKELITLDSSKYRVDSGGEVTFKFTDGAPDDLTDQLVFVLNEDWTRTIGVYRLAIVFDDLSVAQGGFTVSGITPTYKLTLEADTGGTSAPTAESDYGTIDGCYEAGKAVTITAGEAAQYYKFGSWEQDSNDAETVTLEDANASITTFDMPDSPVTITANYIDGEAPETTINPTGGLVIANGKSAWIHPGTTVTLSATDYDVTNSGEAITTKYKIDSDEENIYDDPFTLNAGEHTITYWSVDAKFNIETAKTATIKVDGTAPTASVTIRGETYSDFTSASAGYTRFYKGDAPTLDITGTDSGSDVDTIEYLIDAGDVAAFANEAAAKADTDADWQTWTTGNTAPTLENPGKYRVYVRVKDTVGNVTVVKSDGIVYYEDSGPASANADFTRFGAGDVDVEIALHDNTVASVKNGDALLTFTEDYTVTTGTQDKLTLTAAYLSGLAASETPYIITVNYQPQDVEYVDTTGNDAPAATAISLTVYKAGSTVALTANPTTGTAAYGTPITLTATITGDGTTPTGTVQFYDGENTTPLGTANVENGGKATFTTDAPGDGKIPLGAGGHNLKAVYLGDDDYTGNNNTLSYTVNKASQGDITITSNDVTITAGKITATYGDADFMLMVDGGTTSYAWSSGNTGIATVDPATGKVSIIAAGNVTISVQKPADDNYNASAPGSVNLVISTKAVTISYNTPDIEHPDEKTYDGNTTITLHGTWSITGLKEGDEGSVSVSPGTWRLADANAGTGKEVICTGFDLTSGAGNKADSYKLTGVPTGVTATVTPRAPTWETGSPSASPITYGQTVADSTLSGTALGISGALDGNLVWSAADADTIPAYEDDELDESGYSYAVVFTPTGAGSENYTELTGFATIMVDKADQVLTIKEDTTELTGTVDKSRADGSLTLTANGGGGTADYAWTSDTQSVATISDAGLITFITPGTTAITLNRAGDAKYNIATAVSFTLNISEVESNVTLTATPPSPAAPGSNNVTLTATVTTAGNVTPTGKVIFYKDSGTVTPLGTTDQQSGVEIDEGAASITVTLPAGTYADIHAEYTGDDNYTAGSDALGSYTVNSPYNPPVDPDDPPGGDSEEALQEAVTGATEKIVPVLDIFGENYDPLAVAGFLDAFEAAKAAIDSGNLTPERANELLAGLKTAQTGLVHDHPVISNSASGGITGMGTGAVIAIKGDYRTVTRVTLNGTDFTVGPANGDEPRAISFEGRNAGTISHGSLVIGLTSAFMDSLPNGKYEVLAHFADSYLSGDGDAEFTIDRGADGTVRWAYESGNWYLYDANDGKLTGWQYNGGSWYYLDKTDGIMQTGWLHDGGAWYYLRGNGKMAVNAWVKDNGAWYYLRGNGKMAAQSWVKDNGAWYYLKPGGIMAESVWLRDKSNLYYLKPGGKMAVSERLRIGGTYYRFDGNGVRI